MAKLASWCRAQVATRHWPIAAGMARLFGPVELGLTIWLAIGLTATSNALAQGERSVNAAETDRRCLVNIDRWATALLKDLPAYANRQLVQAGAETRILAAGFPDIDFPADIANISATSRDPELQSNPPEDIARVFFSTAERPRGSAGPRSERAYRLLLARHREGTWFPQSLEIAKSAHLEPTDITEGAIWQAIQQWQDAGCPGVQLPEE